MTGWFYRFGGYRSPVYLVVGLGGYVLCVFLPVGVAACCDGVWFGGLVWSCWLSGVLSDILLLGSRGVA